MHNKTFIHQLHHILTQDDLSEWVKWCEDDESTFTIKPNAPNFSSKVLKRFFKHGNVSSFVRQLHMYGFHKLPHTPSSSTTNNGFPVDSSSSSKNEVEWKFTHHSQDFCKSATETQLKRIHRKSNNIGKDGKRRNVLSPVCVSYLNPTQDGNAATPAISNQDMSRKSSGTTQPMIQAGMSPVPPALTASPILQQQAQQAIPHPLPHQMSIPMGPTSIPTSMPNVPTPISGNGPSLSMSSPVPRVLGTPYHSMTPYPSISYNNGLAPPTTSYHSHMINQYEQNIGLLIRSMLQVCDSLSAKDINAQEHLDRLRASKLELLTTESNWNMLMSNNAATTTAKSSTSTAVSAGNRINSMGSFDSQKNSIFSNPRFSKVQKVSFVGTTTQYTGPNVPASQELDPKVPNSHPSLLYPFNPQYHMDNQKN